MTFDKTTRERLLAHCGELREDDCLDPRDFARSGRTPRGHDRKTLQLCEQVAETLTFLFAGELDDPWLQDLRVEGVAPAPNASQLAVTLRAPLADDHPDLEVIRARLANAAGRLRSEVAASITRKRAPKLVFHVIGETR